MLTHTKSALVIFQLWLPQASFSYRCLFNLRCPFRGVFHYVQSTASFQTAAYLILDWCWSPAWIGVLKNPLNARLDLNLRLLSKLHKHKWAVINIVTARRVQSVGEYWIAEGPVMTTTFEKELTNGVLSVLSEKGFTRTDLLCTFRL